MLTRLSPISYIVLWTFAFTSSAWLTPASHELKAQSEPAFVTTTDIPYTKVNGSELKLDIMAPKEKKGAMPAVMVIHGGAWRAGNKRDCQFIMPDFARKGYVAISPQYRFCPKETFPAQVEDVKAAVRWVKTHAKEYQIDPERLGAVGFSAGGHLSLMLGLTGPADGLEGESGSSAARPTAG